MEDASTVNRCPRKLVVSFGSIRGYLIETDHGERPQLVHCQGQIDLPSRWDRFTTRLGLGKGTYNMPPLIQVSPCAVVGDKPLLDAVRSAYEFITRRYALGDQITLVVNPDTDVYGQVEHFLKAAEMLVRHLHDCTRPPNFFVSDCTAETAIDPIPIHAVLVRAPGDTKSISTWSDELKSRY
ncbi:unnamed protein product [Rhizoctonia solani]|uniref:Uncharacterized protein n=1 Tax=Rhizoctonia solani TaxID=456999 RepID=A0A8H3ECU2_9AGAM|nr:unnamed protein product [Rhizoctonia solani]